MEYFGSYNELWWIAFITAWRITCSLLSVFVLWLQWSSKILLFWNFIFFVMTAVRMLVTNGEIKIPALCLPHRQRHKGGIEHGARKWTSPKVDDLIPFLNWGQAVIGLYWRNCSRFSMKDADFARYSMSFWLCFWCLRISAIESASISKAEALWIVNWRCSRDWSNDVNLLYNT